MTDETPTLHTLDKKIDRILVKIECIPDHEERLRVVETRTVAMSVVFSITGLAGIIGLIKILFGV